MCAAPGPAASQMEAIDTLEIARHARALSADSLMGRATGTRELELAAQYIATSCSDIGLLPIGSDYHIEVPLIRATIADTTTLTVITDGVRVRRFSHGRDFVVNAATSATLRSMRGRAVLVGNDAQIRSGELAAPVEGAVAVTLGTVTPQASHHLAERGAVAMVHLVADTAVFKAAHPAHGLLHIFTPDQIVSSLAPVLPSIVAAPALSGQLYNALLVGAPVTIETRLVATSEEFVSHNVACRLTGNDPRAQRGVIAFTAHYDHLGTGSPDARGDSIFNGFSDNAAGVGMLLAIARAAAHRQREFRNDLLFLFFTAEELGLIGSDYFVSRPPIPLEQFRAVINLDAGAPPAPPWSWRIAGGDHSDLGTAAVDVALSQGWSATTSPAVPNSDYFPFWRVGVPAVFIVPGIETFEGLTADSSRSLRARWDRYHQLGDEWDPQFPLSGLGRYAEYALSIARRVDTLP